MIQKEAIDNIILKTDNEIPEALSELFEHVSTALLRSGRRNEESNSIISALIDDQCYKQNSGLNILQRNLQVTLL